MYVPIWGLIVLGIVFVYLQNSEITKAKRIVLYIVEMRLRYKNPHHALDFEDRRNYDKEVDEEILYMASLAHSNYLPGQYP